MRRFPKRAQGYTLVEIVLVVALFVVVGSMFVVLDQNFISRNDLDVATETVTESLRRARILSTASSGDEVWGVRIIEGEILIFRGESYSTRDAVHDEISHLPASVSISGVSEIVFDKLYGEPSVVGDVVLTSEVNSSNVVTINEVGIVHH